MNTYLHTGLILLAAYLAVFLQSSVGILRNWTGTQIDLLPVLMVYCGLNGRLVPLTATAVTGGIAFDSLSSNPLGVSVLPLFIVGLVALKVRELVLRDQPYARLLLGFGASAAAPLIAVFLLWGCGARPLIQWGSLLQWILMAVTGAVLTPLSFWFFESVNAALTYRRSSETTFRADREMKRGRG